jgi:hypothetical protein
MFRSLCANIRRILGKDIRREMVLKLHETTLLLSSLCGCGTWTRREDKIRKVKAPGIQFLTLVVGYTFVDRRHGERNLNFETCVKQFS